MKRSQCAVVMLVLAAGCIGQAQAEDRVQVTPRVTREMIAENLMGGLSSDNKGLRESAAFMLGEQKVTRAVVPLMQMLHSDAEESSRIVAALSLCRIGEARGVFAVRQAAKFDTSERVRRLCAWFFNEHVQAGSFAFVTPEGEATVQFGGR
jgi:hypothetical protein